MKRLRFVLASSLFVAACGGAAREPVAPAIVVAPERAVDPSAARPPPIDSTAKNPGIDDLVAAFADAAPADRASLLQQIRDEHGGKGLVLALDAKSKSADDPSAYERDKQRNREVMSALGSLADPRAADALAHFIDQATSPHWKFEAAVRLAEIGDVRAAAALGARLAQDPLKLYREDRDPEFRRDDSERIIAARMLADLATIHPDAHADLRAAAEAQTIQWLTDKPEPHANGLRFLAYSESTAILPKLRAWADFKDPLPPQGAMSFPAAFATAQVALRFLGKTKDPSAFAILQKQLKRRPKDVDATMDSLMQGGSAVRGMALRALGVGAADGFAELGDARAVPILETYIEDPKENEQARMEACSALAWIASDAQLEAVAHRAVTFGAKGANKEAHLVTTCYLETLARKATPAASTIVFNAFFQAFREPEIRHAAARAMGLNGVPSALGPKLVAMLQDDKLREDAALALLLGGAADEARDAVAYYGGDVGSLKAAYSQSFGFFSDAAYDRGDIGRWATNAAACRDSWPRAIVSNSLANVVFDSGPHSLTRAVFRHRMLEDARSTKEPEHTRAGLLLLLAKEDGILAALGDARP